MDTETMNMDILEYQEFVRKETMLRLVVTTWQNSYNAEELYKVVGYVAKMIGVEKNKIIE